MDIKENQNMEHAILEAAEKLFLEKGFALTSTTEIARNVGCNQALVHYYFRTKDNLFNTIFEHKFRQFFRHIFDLDNMEGLSFTEKIRKIIESHFDMVKANGKLPLLIITEFTRKPELIDALKEKLKDLPIHLIEKMDKELQQEIAAGHFRPTNFLDLIFNMISLNLSLFLLLPVASKVIAMSPEQQQIMINHRREEHVNVILNSIRP